MKDYIIYIDKINTSVVHVPAKSKKEAMLIANRFIDDINEDRLDINKIVQFNPEYKIKVRKSSTQIGAFFIGGKRWKYC